MILGMWLSNIATTAWSDLDILKWWSDAINQFNPRLGEVISSISRNQSSEWTKTLKLSPHAWKRQVWRITKVLLSSCTLTVILYFYYCVLICCYYTKWLRIKREKMPLSTVDKERFKEHKLFNSKNQPQIVTLLCTMNYLCMQSINYFLYYSQV